MSTTTTTETKSRVNRRAFSAEAEATHTQRSEPRSVAYGVQAKLKIGQPNDRFEREADATADRILSAPAPTQTGAPPSETSSLSAIHQSTIVPSSSEASAKGGLSLAVGRDPGRTSYLDIQADFESNEAETVQPKLYGETSSSLVVVRDPGRTSSLVQASANGELSTTDSFDSQLASHSDSGSPLPSGLQGQMESGMGADLSGVRVHTDSQAVQMSQDIGAKAFTHGSDIYFNQGQYQPQTSEGQHLIAHETTHTVQQGASPVQREADPTASAPGETPISLSFEDTAAPPPTAEDILQAEEAGKVDTGVPAEGEAAAPPPAPTPTDAGPAAGPPAGEGPQGPAEPVPEEAAEAEPKAEKQPVAAGNPEDSAQAHMNAPATQLAQQQAGIAADVTAGMQGQRQATQAKMPPLKADNTGKPEDLEAEQEGLLPEGKAAPITDGVTGQEPPPAQKGAHRNLGPAPDVEKNNHVLNKQKIAAFLSWFKSNFFSFSSTIKTKDPNVNTSAGERPKVPQKGKADPQRADTQKKDSDAQVDKQTTEAKDAIEANPGQENIQPQDVTEEKPMNISQEVAELSAERNQEMEDFLALGLPPDVQAVTDQDMQPLLDKSLAQPRADVAAAAKKRDDDTQTEITKANEETAKLNEEAARQQKETVEQNRVSVAETQRKGKEDADGLMADFDTQASEKQRQAKEDIDKEVKDREKEADDELKKGEKKATDKKKAEEDKAAAKKRQMEKESKNKSWWERAADAVKSAVSAITSAISSIFKALREAVTAIIDAAKDLALKAIEAARKFAIAALDALGSVLKGLVDTFLGTLFPELAKKINEAIDATVNKAKKAVNAIADGLKKGVEALAEAAKAAVNKVLEVFETALTAAVQIAGALVTGDYAEALKVAIKSACKIAGIPTKPVFDFINKAGDTINTILKDPGKFATNLGNAVGGGVKLFRKNIKKHLLNGLIGWLTGAMSGVPIQLPTKWDVPGIVFIGLQLLGATFDNVRAKVVKKLGPKGEMIVNVLEKSAGILQKVLRARSVQPVLAEQEKAVKGLKEQIMSKIQGTVILEVVKAGVKWLLGLLNPASAIVKAVKMVFDVTMFLIDNKDRIITFVQSIFNTLGPIAQGKLGKASKAVEEAMGRSVPLILGMLGAVASVGGIGNSIAKAIKSLTAPIQKAIEMVVKKLVDFAKKAFKKGKAGLKKIGKMLLGAKAFFKKREPLKLGKKGHHLYDEKGKLKLASNTGMDPTKTFEFVNQIHPKLNDDEALKNKVQTFLKSYAGTAIATEVYTQANTALGTSANIQESLRLYRELQKLERTWKSTARSNMRNDNTKKPSGELPSTHTEVTLGRTTYHVRKDEKAAFVLASEIISNSMPKTIKQLMGSLANLVYQENYVPNTILKLGGFQDFQDRMWEGSIASGKKIASPLTIKGANGSAPKGSVTSSGPYKNLYTRTSQWNAGHLVSQSYHGPGDKNNLIPMTTELNNEFRREVETRVKDHLTMVSNPANLSVPVYHFEVNISSNKASRSTLITPGLQTSEPDLYGLYLMEENYIPQSISAILKPMAPKPTNPKEFEIHPEYASRNLVPSTSFQNNLPTSVVSAPKSDRILKKMHNRWKNTTGTAEIYNEKWATMYRYLFGGSIDSNSKLVKDVKKEFEPQMTKWFLDYHTGRKGSVGGAFVKMLNLGSYKEDKKKVFEGSQTDYQNIIKQHKRQFETLRNKYGAYYSVEHVRDESSGRGHPTRIYRVDLTSTGNELYQRAKTLIGPSNFKNISDAGGIYTGGDVSGSISADSKEILKWMDANIKINNHSMTISSIFEQTQSFFKERFDKTIYRQAYSNFVLKYEELKIKKVSPQIVFSKPADILNYPTIKSYFNDKVRASFGGHEFKTRENAYSKFLERSISFNGASKIFEILFNELVAAGIIIEGSDSGTYKLAN
ncbi:MAG: DUF4157 domain-containing protein [Bacteroidota bacterium]